MQRDSMALVAQVELAVLHERGLEGLPAVRDEQRRIEAATAYIELGLYEMAERLLRPEADSGGSATASYLRAYVAELAGDRTEAARLRQQAARAPVRGDLPSRLEELAAFEAALRANPDDTNAHYLAGLVLYSKDRQREAVDHWRRATELGHEDAMVYRCLGAVISREKPQEAASYFRQALDRDGRVIEFYVDLDEICQELGNLPGRIEALEQGVRMLPQRDTLAHRLGEAYFDAGRYDDAVQTYLSLRFHIAEGRYELHDHYAAALLGRAMVHYQAGRCQAALVDLDAALEYPENLNIGRPTRDHGTGAVHYWRGVVLAELQRPEQASDAWRRAAEGGHLSRWVRPTSPGQVVSALHAFWARRALGQDDEADALRKELDEACTRYEKMWPPHGQACATLIRGLIAAGDGRLDQARQGLDEAQAGSNRLAGYVRLSRMWVALLDRHSSTRPAQAATQPVVTAGGG
jgi:tetratricopeptide (TPR) repeat protein